MGFDLWTSSAGSNDLVFDFRIKEIFLCNYKHHCSKKRLDPLNASGLNHL